MTRTYDEQREEGAAMIIAEAQSLAETSGGRLISAIFDRGLGMKHLECHLLELATEHMTVAVSFTDDMLADFPSGVGTGRTIRLIRRGVEELLAETK